MYICTLLYYLSELGQYTWPKLALALHVCFNDCSLLNCDQVQGHTPMLSLVEVLDLYTLQMLGALEQNQRCLAVGTVLHPFFTVVIMKMQE